MALWYSGGSTIRPIAILLQQEQRCILLSVAVAIIPIKNMPGHMQTKNKEMFFSKQSTLFPIHQTYASANPYKQKRTNHCIESARKNKWTPSTTSHEDYVLPSCMKVKMDQWMKVHLSQGLI